MTTQCRSCGAAASENQKFCSKCGVQLSLPANTDGLAIGSLLKELLLVTIFAAIMAGFFTFTIVQIKISQINEMKEDPYYRAYNWDPQSLPKPPTPAEAKDLLIKLFIVFFVLLSLWRVYDAVKRAAHLEVEEK